MDYFDFCHFCLNPIVESSAVCAEGYDVTNLISSDPTKKQKGFMVYRTINPPIDITFTFMCKVNISHIFIWPQVGNQKSSGFQISTCTAKSSSDQMPKSQPFFNVGSGFLKNEPGIIFHHSHEPSDRKVCNFLKRRLSIRQNALSAVKAVQIRILKTHQSSVPAILRVEIWGLPSVSCPKEIRMKIFDLWKQKDKKNVTPSETKKCEERSEEKVLRTTALALTNNNFDIPEDFIDPITCEVMVLPFILPSGKIVDKTTLEKHENQEANWGRRPSDPFTGKAFSDTSKPVPASSLKARIDKFLIQHADVEELKKVPRTVGRKLNSGSSSKVSNVVDISNKAEEVEKCAETESFRVLKEKEQMSTSVKRKETPELLIDVKKRIKKECSGPEIVIGSTFHSITTSSVASLSRSHEDDLNDSLDAALKSALSGLPSFTKFTSEDTEGERKVCSLCKETQVLYILPCQHFLCRTCLIKKTTDNDCHCSNCNLPFKSADPKRYFA